MNENKQNHKHDNNGNNDNNNGKNQLIHDKNTAESNDHLQKIPQLNDFDEDEHWTLNHQKINICVTPAKNTTTNKHVEDNKPNPLLANISDASNDTDHSNMSLT